MQLLRGTLKSYPTFRSLSKLVIDILPFNFAVSELDEPNRWPQHAVPVEQFQHFLHDVEEAGQRWMCCQSAARVTRFGTAAAT
jgi:hypothetical protein